MTPTQILYFLTVAKTLNITRAAKQLYISQPALSKQIAVIEKELNLQLLLRGKNMLRLTPAGEVLLRELPGFLAQYEDIIDRAKAAYQGYVGTLNIGVLDGHSAGGKIRDVLLEFSRQFPNVNVSLIRHSFDSLRQGLHRQDLDFAVTLSLDLDGNSGLKWECLEESPALLSMPRTHPLATLDSIPPALLQDETFIFPHDSTGAQAKLQEFFTYHGFSPSTKAAPNLATIMLWVEAGLGIAVLNGKNALYENPNVILLPVEGLTVTEVVCAWKPDNPNFAVPLFLSTLRGVTNGKED